MSTANLVVGQKLSITEMMNHRYNDDLLLKSDIRERAKQEFPGVYFILDHPNLRLAFQETDKQANEAKAQSHIMGSISMMCALLALMFAGAAPVWTKAPESWSSLIAVCSGALGVAAVAIGSAGILFGKRKQRWLHARLYTERLRQFHFQSFIWRLPEIAEASADPKKQAAFTSLRHGWLLRFQDSYQKHLGPRLEVILDTKKSPDLWLHDSSSKRRPELPVGYDPTELFMAYRKLRFVEQSEYARHKLRRHDYSLNILKMPIRAQQQFFNFLWTIAFGVLLLLHVYIVISHLGRHAGADHVWLHVAVIWSALIALASRTLEDGFAVKVEIDRYEEYLANTLDSLRRFDEATDNGERLDAMLEMERESYEEMRGFLRSNFEATFVL